MPRQKYIVHTSAWFAESSKERQRNVSVCRTWNY